MTRIKQISTINLIATLTMLNWKRPKNSNNYIKGNYIVYFGGDNNVYLQRKYGQPFVRYPRNKILEIITEE